MSLTLSTAIFNRRWATLILEALSRHQVQHVCIAPGSRSTSLTLAAAANPRLICHTHFDERGLGHLALGLAKASGQPVAVIVTSGTAVANLYPAIIEAGLTGERLIMLTADRPPELIDCGANQAIRQPEMFASHAQQTLNLPRPTPDISARWLVSAIDNGISALSHGALHINCPFAEPLYGEQGDDYLDWSQSLGDWWQGTQPWLRSCAPQPHLTQPDWSHWRQKRGVIIAGRMSAQAGLQLAQWAKTLGWPLLSDVQSHTDNPLPCADLWLANPQAHSVLAKAQLVVQLGSSLTGKRLLQWQANCQPEEYWLVDPLPGRLDPAQHRGRRLQMPISDWLTLHPAQPQVHWASALEALSLQVSERVQRRLDDHFGEASLARQLPALLPQQGQLFLGNSLVVRLVDALAQLPAGYPVFANRGASGIDGLISTAAGVQRATGKPTLVLIGDLSALYDLNALALMRQSSAPTVIIVVNNNGGQIFSLLPTPQAERERFYCMPQNVEFSHAAAMFGLSYACPNNFAALSEAVNHCWQHGGVKLIELKVSPTDGADILRELVTQAGDL
jgi:2-succinyl-5-enolpyruvyl-6-hydroxy-3-cyclohexene-1-carboxylate synthase